MKNTLEYDIEAGIFLSSTASLTWADGTLYYLSRFFRDVFTDFYDQIHDFFFEPHQD